MGGREGRLGGWEGRKARWMGKWDGARQEEDGEGASVGRKER